MQRDERDSVTGTRAKGRPDEQLSAPSRSHLDGPRPADAGSGLLSSEQSCSRLTPPDVGGAVVLAGRTGIGMPVEVRVAGGWLDFRFIDKDGEQRGFSLNSFYGGQFALGLVAVLVNGEGYRT